MRRAVIILVAVMMCAGYSFGQTNGLPQWKVVREFHVTNSSAVHSVVLLTPKSNTLYRITAYLTSYAQQPQQGYYDFQFLWTDRAGLHSNLELPTCNNGSCYPSRTDTQIFSPAVGTQVILKVVAKEDPQNVTYDFVFTIEQLTH